MAVVIPLKAPLPPRRGSPGPPHARDADTEALPTPVLVEIEAFSAPGRIHPLHLGASAAGNYPRAGEPGGSGNYPSKEPEHHTGVHLCVRR